jgi:hypothetical protein
MPGMFTKDQESPDKEEEDIMTMLKKRRENLTNPTSVQHVA